MDRIDVTLISGARPDLLNTTLDSFDAKLFPFFEIRNVFANIDPVFGDRRAQKACFDLIRAKFPKAEISTTTKGSFGGAVKRLWQMTSDAHVLHMEDDWELNAKIKAEEVLPLFGDDVGMVQFAIQNQTYYGGDYLYITQRKRIFGHELWSKKVNAYGTSPRFIRKGLCNVYGQLLKPHLDPEKQVYKNKNKALSKAHQPWRCRLIYAEGGAPLITDIGREWRATRRIEKVDARGGSTWIQE